MSKIEWCDMTWNPVWGCKNNCEYCYARKIARRFARKIADKEVAYKKLNYNSIGVRNKIEDHLKSFDPTWLESNFNKNFPTKPSRIFVNSMSDIGHWKPEWVDAVIEKIKEHPQHTFIFLTKDYSVYGDYIFPDNCWLGYSLSTQYQIDDFCYNDGYYPVKNILFISLEPIQEHVKIPIDIDWLIVGAETGNRKEKIIPHHSWIEEFENLKIPVFMKDNLIKYYHKPLKQEFPK